MFDLKDRKKIRSGLEALRDGAGRRRFGDRLLLNRLATEGPLFDRWIENERAKWDRKNPKLKGAIGDGEFLKYILDLLKQSGIFEILVAAIIKMITGG
jgi:hypothetical protein